MIMLRLVVQTSQPSISTATDIFPASSITSNTTPNMFSLSTIKNATQASSFDLASSSTIISASFNLPSTSQFSNNVKPVAAEQMLSTSLFPIQMLKSVYLVAPGGLATWTPTGALTLDPKNRPSERKVVHVQEQNNVANELQIAM